MRRLVLAVTLLVALAGCSSATPTLGEPTPTFTPVPIPGDSDVALVSHAGVASPAALVAAHERQLGTRNGTWRVYAGMFTFGPDYDYSLSTSRNGSRYRAVLRTDVERYVNDSQVHDRTTVDYYHTGDRVLVAVEHGDDVRYERRPADTAPPFSDIRRAQLLALFEAADVEVANSRSPSGNYRLYAAPFTVERLPTYRGVVTDATVSPLYVTATADGYLIGYAFNYEGTLDGTEVRGWFQYGPSDEDLFEEPAWYDDAQSATPDRETGPVWPVDSPSPTPTPAATPTSG